MRKASPRAKDMVNLRLNSPDQRKDSGHTVFTKPFLEISKYILLWDAVDELIRRVAGKVMLPATLKRLSKPGSWIVTNEVCLLKFDSLPFIDSINVYDLIAFVRTKYIMTRF